MGYTIRNEQPADHRAVEILTWHAFAPGIGGGEKGNPDEALLVRRLRADPAFVPALDFVALDGEELVGSILYAQAAIVREGLPQVPVLTFGPLSVAPARQKQSVAAR